MNIHTLCEISTAIGTNGAVFTALWLGLKDRRPKLQVSAYTGINPTTGEKHLWMYCANLGKQPVFCSALAFIPNRFNKDGLRIAPHPDWMMVPPSVNLPYCLEYSAYLSQHFKKDFFQIRKQYPNLLSKHNWLARLQLKFFWRVTADTTVGNWTGKLSKSLIEEILRYSPTEENVSETKQFSSLTN